MLKKDLYLSEKQQRDISHAVQDAGEIDYFDKIAKAASNHTLKMILDKLDEPCKEDNHASAKYYYATHGYYCHKSSCHECLQELKKMVEE